MEAREGLTLPVSTIEKLQCKDCKEELFLELDPDYVPSFYAVCCDNRYYVNFTTAEVSVDA